MKVLKITIVLNAGADHVEIDTDLPNGMYPFTGNQYLTMKLACDTGVEYCKKHFPDIVPTVVQRVKQSPGFRGKDT